MIVIESEKVQLHLLSRDACPASLIKAEGERKNSTLELNYRMEYGWEVKEFVRILEEEGWEYYGYDPSEARPYLDDLSLIRDADFLGLRCLLTYYLRSERFGDGAWLVLIQNGFLTAVLRRLKDISG